ncbi:MAG: hypothetical protein ACOC57_06645 [Acidobacteriota bacterium]
MSSKRMAKKFSQVRRNASWPENLIPFNPHKDSCVIFSDHHKGDGSPADDFRKNASLYDKALCYYQERGFRLLLVGDNEELWENRFDQIMPKYENILKKEITLSLKDSKGRVIRIYGNHDKEVSLKSFQKSLKFQQDHIFRNVDFREGLCLGEHIFLIHGHQGRFFDDKAWKLSRWAVKFIWKTIQKIFNIGIDGPAENPAIRNDLEKQYYSWSKKNKTILICGHTHRAVFASHTHYSRLTREKEQLEKLLATTSPESPQKLENDLIEVKKEIGKILKKTGGIPPPTFEPNPLPCYFNDGCCGYTNGITCLEIEDGWIRLVKWEKNSFKRLIYQESLLESCLKETLGRKKKIPD